MGTTRQKSSCRNRLQNGPRSLSQVKVGTPRLRQQDRTQRLTRRNRGLPDGAAITILGAFRTFTNIPGPGNRTAYFAAFGSWSEALLKDTESLRDSDALMRVAVPRRRGPAGLRDLFSFLSKLRLVCPVPDTSFGSPDAPACAVPVQAASQLVPFRLGVQWFSVETGRIFCYNFGKRVT